MLYLKEGYPEVDEIVKCTVKRIYGNTVFVTLDEYEKEGVLIVSEIAPGRIRNIRDYVVENKTIICKIIRVVEARNQIDVSLRRVPVKVMQDKLNEIKQEEFAEKIYDDVAKKANTTKDKLFENTYEAIFAEYTTVFEALYEIMIDEKKIKNFKKLSEEERKYFIESINERIKPEEFIIKVKISAVCPESKGIEKIKEFFSEAKKQTKWKNITFSYLAAGKYLAKISHDSLKQADKVAEKMSDFLIDNAKKYNVELKIKRLD